MRVAIIGANGLLGSALKRHLIEKKIEFLPLLHKDFDITNENDYSKILDFKPDVVINTAAYLGVEPCEARPMKAFEINSLAVANLARFCEKNSIILAYISTDAVFDGKTGNYDEDSMPNPLNMYGLTKYNGEIMTRNLCPKHYIFRIPILFGKRENKGNIFIEKMYNLYLKGNKELKIADDVINRPSYNIDIAGIILDIILNNYEFGIYHVFNDGKASLYDFAVEFFKQKGIIDIKIERAKAKDFAKNEKGKKPLNTTLISKKIKPLRHWKEAMKEFILSLKNENY